MRILGIDPGIGTVGFGVIDAERGKNTYVACGVITTPPNTALSPRLDMIYNDLNEIIVTFAPAEIAVEELFFSKNITTGIAVAHGRGVILLSAYRSGVPVFEYTPMQVKQAVVGYGGAQKRQVIYMIQKLLHMSKPPRPDDAADALALAICHARSRTSALTAEGESGPCSTI
ncbi:MAG: crossover junction endodeoxyribonuclease RuvC [Oscillospiraceae bacterium]|nr:crossover junction endodeoxyribonuclease RuvC [Oscillospiraceae bacterium]MCD8117330.1 crossover junction endodeoxyribonuclease RuvC [Oscillospiraceae bacterium]